MRSVVILMGVIAPICYSATIQYKRDDLLTLQTNISDLFIGETDKTLKSLEGPRNFHKFLEEHLENNVLKYTLSPLTKLGENYRSELQAVDVELYKGSRSNEVNMICNQTL